MPMQNKNANEEKNVGTKKKTTYDYQYTLMVLCDERDFFPSFSIMV